ncbi:hypothetical protein EJB05_10465, partial [Eragrostis curvula]
LTPKSCCPEPGRLACAPDGRRERLPRLGLPLHRRSLALPCIFFFSSFSRTSRHGRAELELALRCPRLIPDPFLKRRAVESPGSNSPPSSMVNRAAVTMPFDSSSMTKGLEVFDTQQHPCRNKTRRGIATKLALKFLIHSNTLVAIFSKLKFPLQWTCNETRLCAAPRRSDAS